LKNNQRIQSITDLNKHIKNCKKLEDSRIQKIEKDKNIEKRKIDLLKGRIRKFNETKIKTCSICGTEKDIKHFYKSKLYSYRQSCRECHNKVVVEWRNDNPGKYKSIQTKRRALKLDALHPDHNTDIENTLELMRKRVTECTGIKFAMDHIFPLSKGGLHHHLNLQIIPHKINNNKLANLSYHNPSILDFTDMDRTILKECMIRSKKFGFLAEVKIAIEQIKFQKRKKVERLD
jgi:hypothetical protein